MMPETKKRKPRKQHDRVATVNSKSGEGHSIPPLSGPRVKDCVFSNEQRINDQKVDALDKNGSETNMKKKKGSSSKANGGLKSPPVHLKDSSFSESEMSTKSTLEEELEWCISQLENGILKPDASKGQKQEKQKFLKLLQSEKTLLPRKRQVMKNLFGDYRSKMKKDPGFRSMSVSTVIKCAENEKCQMQGKFFRKSVKHFEANAEKKTAIVVNGIRQKGTVSNNCTEFFCFNFDVEFD